MTQQWASKQVKDLEALGYLERVGNAGDQRVKQVRLTGRGRAMLAEARRLRAELESDLARKLGGTAVETSKQVLRELLSVTELTGDVRARRVPLPD